MWNFSCKPTILGIRATVGDWEGILFSWLYHEIFLSGAIEKIHLKLDGDCLQIFVLCLFFLRHLFPKRKVRDWYSHSLLLPHSTFARLVSDKVNLFMVIDWLWHSDDLNNWCHARIGKHRGWLSYLIRENFSHEKIRQNVGR